MKSIKFFYFKRIFYYHGDLLGDLVQENTKEINAQNYILVYTKGADIFKPCATLHLI